MNDYWKEVLAHRQIKDPSERISANMALRKMREEKNTRSRPCASA